LTTIIFSGPNVIQFTPAKDIVNLSQPEK